MHNANHFIRCESCGTEFKSAFAGAVSAIGCVEECPSCHKPLPTPLLVGDNNLDLLQRALRDPIVHLVGEGGRDGYIFMGRGDLAVTVRSQLLLPVHAAYDRNIRRAIDLLDMHEGLAKARVQVLLSAVYMLTMTAYECLTDDLLLALQSKGLATNQKGKPNLHQRRKHLFDSLQVPIGVPPLDYLYAFRNCLAHSAGIVDDAFVKKLEEIGATPEHLRSFSVGAPLVLDASMASSFADSLQHVARNLFSRAQELCQVAHL